MSAVPVPANTTILNHAATQRAQHVMEEIT
jgi:hypothetical protein